MATSNTGLLFEATFNSGSDVTAMGFKHSGNKDTPIVDIAGQRAVKISLDHYSSEYSYRTEIQPTKFPTPNFTSGMFAKVGQEYWYGMRYLMDDSWRASDTGDSVLMQFHSQPDAGEEWRNPPVSLQVVNKSGVQHLNLIVRSDAGRITTGSGEGRYDSSKQYDLGPITGDIGRWTDIAWHVKWNYDGTGYLQLYKNGQLLVDLTGANCFNDATGPYLKMGLYKYDWQSSADTGADSKTIHYDDLRVGGASASLDTVSHGSGGGGPSTPPTTPTVPPAPPPAPTPSTITGGAGHETLATTTAADVIDGGAGIDSIRISGSASRTLVTEHGHAAATVTALDGSTASDTLRGVEILRFDDGVRLLNIPTAPMVWFDEALYLERNPDVAAAVRSGGFASGAQHFDLYGHSEGREGTFVLDEDFYRAQNPDVDQAIASGSLRSAADHFARFGMTEGRDSSALFSTEWYLSHNPDVASAAAQGATTAYEHYFAFGWREGRDPSQWFDTDGYQARYADVAAAGVNPLEHFLNCGMAEGRLAVPTDMVDW